MSGELSGDSMFVGAWSDMLGGKKSGDGNNGSPIDKNVTTETPVLDETTALTANACYKKQVSALSSNGRRRTRGSAIVLSSQKMQKFLRSDSNDGNSPNRGSDLIAATDGILDARKALIRRNKAAVGIQSAWRLSQLRRRKLQQMLVYLQGGKWTKSQSDHVFSLFLGWRVRFLMRSASTQKSLSALNDVYSVIIEIISSPSSKSPSTLRSGDTIENQANFHRQIMLDLVSESNRNLFQSEAGRSLGISLSPQGFSDSDRTYADRVLVDRLIKEALMKRRVVYGIFFDDAIWCLLPNLTNNAMIGYDGDDYVDWNFYKDNRNDMDVSESFKIDSEIIASQRRLKLRSWKIKCLGAGYWDVSSAIKSILSTHEAHLNIAVDSIVHTVVGNTARSPVNHYTSAETVSNNSPLGFSNAPSPSKESHNTQHTIKQLSRQRSDTFHSDTEEFQSPSKIRDVYNSSQSPNKNVIQEMKRKGHSILINNSVEKIKIDNNLLHRQPSFSLNFDIALPEKGEGREIGGKGSEILSRKGSGRGLLTDGNEIVIQSQLVSLRAQVQNAMKKKTHSESFININNIDNTENDTNDLDVVEDKSSYNFLNKENSVGKGDDNKVEIIGYKSKVILPRKVPVTITPPKKLSTTSFSMSSSCSSEAASISIRPDGMKASIQLDILQADRLMLAKKVTK